MRRLRWYRWSVVIVGNESGNRRTLSFVRYRHRHQAEAFCRRANAQSPSDLTYFEPVEIQ
jgi:hypothetical protein